MRKPAMLRTLDKWVEFVLVPLALVTALGVLWASAHSGDDGQYGIPAIAIGVVWAIVLIIADVARYRHRAAWLLVWPLAGAVWAAWFVVYDFTMDDRGIVEDCAVVGTYDEEVDSRGGTYWTRTYTLECEHDTVTVTERIDSKPIDYDLDSYDLGGYDTLPFDAVSPLRPETIEVEYDPRGLLDARRTEEPGLDGESMLWVTGVVLAAGIGLRVALATSRAGR